MENLFLSQELQTAFNGDPWHGDALFKIINNNNINSVNATERKGNHHNIAEIVVHLTSWTLEVIDRLNGQSAKEPVHGDWQIINFVSQQEWQTIKSDLENANTLLTNTIKKLSDQELEKISEDKRNPSLGTGKTYKQTLYGIIQHYAYHAGQINLIHKLI